MFIVHKLKNVIGKEVQSVEPRYLEHPREKEICSRQRGFELSRVIAVRCSLPSNSLKT